jgi:hypothetical protein
VTVPNTIEGFRIGARVRDSGVLFVHSGTSRLDLPIEVSFAKASALTGGFEPDDFLAGVRRAASIHHEALLPFVTGGLTDGLVYAIAKTLEGRTLEDVVARDGPFPEPRALALAASIAGALTALERGGMRHGDLAPARVISAGPVTFVVGPPRLVPASLSPRADHWQAPEEARGGEHGVQSDLFVLGLIVVFAMTGAHPLADAPDARRALRDWKTPDMVVLLRGASPETRGVVAKLLAAESANRFASAADAARAIEEASNAPPETAPVVMPPGAPAARPAPEPAKRTPGRLYVEARLGEAMLEIDDDAVYVGANQAKNVRAQVESFAEAAIRVERTAAADVVYAMNGGLRVNGAAVESHPLADGDHVEAPGIVARYERATRTALRSSRLAAPEAPPVNRAAGPIVAAAMIATMAALAWGTLRVTGAMKRSSDAGQIAARAEQALAEEKRLSGAPEAGHPATTAAAVQAEIAARDAYAAAAQWARHHPSDARAKYYEVWQRWSDTAYGLLGRLDALEIDRRTKAPPDKTFETLLAEAEAADGNVDDDTLMKLRGYVEEHPGTLVGARAHVALVKAQAIQRGRLDADFAAINAAIARKDWREAKALIGKVRDYAPSALVEEVQAFVDKIVKGMGETLLESSGAGHAGDGAPGGKPDDGSSAKISEADRNRKAEEIFRGARKAMDGGKDVEALEGFLTFLREYKDTPNGAKYDPETRGRISTLTTGPAGIVKLFRGKVEKADNKGRWRVTYDFSDPEQLRDFKDVAAFEQPPRAIWKAEGGAVKNARGSGAFVLDAVFKADEISTSVVVNAKRPHDIGILYMDPSEQRRFYLFTLQNTFFTLGKGDTAKPFLENAIVLFGPNMWKDTPPGQLGFVRKCGADEPTVREAEPTPLKAGKSEGEVWMKFEGGRSIRGSAYGDTKYDFPGITPGLFVIGSEGYFDDFVVEGVPDMDWVQKRWRAILSGL